MLTRPSAAAIITFTCNDLLYSLNKPDACTLSTTEFIGADGRPRYARRSFPHKSDFGVTSVNHSFAELLTRAVGPGSGFPLLRSKLEKLSSGIALSFPRHLTSSSVGTMPPVLDLPPARKIQGCAPFDTNGKTHYHFGNKKGLFRSGVYMEISFRTRKLARIFDSKRALIREYGNRAARTIMIRLAVLQDSETLAEVPKTPPDRMHQLTGNRDEQFAVYLVHPYRLVFEPDHDPLPRKKDGGLDLELVTAIMVMEVVDYHPKSS